MLFIFQMVDVHDGGVKVSGYVAADSQEQARERVEKKICSVPYNYLNGDEKLELYEAGDVWIERTSYLQHD